MGSGGSKANASQTPTNTNTSAGGKKTPDKQPNQTQNEQKQEVNLPPISTSDKKQTSNPESTSTKNVPPTSPLPKVTEADKNRAAQDKQEKTSQTGTDNVRQVPMPAQSVGLVGAMPSMTGDPNADLQKACLINKLSNAKTQEKQQEIEVDAKEKEENKTDSKTDSKAETEKNESPPESATTETKDTVQTQKSSEKKDKSDSQAQESSEKKDISDSQAQEKTDISDTPEQKDSSVSNQNKPPVAKVKEEKIDRVVPPPPEDQKKFDDAINIACSLIKPESVMKRVTTNVTKLELLRALPSSIDLFSLLSKITNLQELDLHSNNLGPQGFRSICLAMCTNSTIHSLNLASNQADTDSAECVGKMLSQNSTLVYLDVSSNYLGKDFFSRNVGPVLKTNTTLRTLRAESIGSTDVRLLMEGLQENQTLTEIDFSGNSITDRTVLGKGFAAVLKKPGCCLETLALSNCDMNAQGLEALREGLHVNTSLLQLNLNGNEITSLQGLLKMVATVSTHPRISTFCVDSSKVKDTTLKDDEDVKICVRDGSPLSLDVLSISNCSLTDAFWEMLTVLLKGRQLSLCEIDIGGNGDLTSVCVKSIVGLTSDSDGDNMSCLRKLNFSVIDKADGLTDQLMTGHCPHLTYLNIRKSRMSDHQKLPMLYTGTGAKLTTLILDGHKLANTDILSVLLGDEALKGSLKTLSIEGCSLSPDDISPLCQSLKKGLGLAMLKVAGNRLESKGVIDIVEALLCNKTHPLAVLDVSSNIMDNEGAKCLSTLFTTKKHKSQLHSLNVSINNIGREGLLSLVSVVGGKFPLKTLYLQRQSQGLDEGEMEEILTKLAGCLGFTIKPKGDTLEESCTELSSLPESLMIKVNSLGGYTGKIGSLLDSRKIFTDYPEQKLSTLTFSHCQTIAAYLKGTGSETCVWSDEEWKLIIGANKPTNDTPSWLQLASSRDTAVYLGNLAGNTTRQKIEALLEMEADCNLDEVCLMKDPVTRSINGVGWVLLCDKESVQRAVEFYNSGEAKIFGQSFSVSAVNVKVDDEANALTEANARDDKEKRSKLMSKEEQAHRNLIRHTTEESWKRHEYRLAHPAYADGRIW